MGLYQLIYALLNFCVLRVQKVVQQDDKIDDFVKKIRENFDVSYLFHSWHEYVDFSAGLIYYLALLLIHVETQSH
jgi:hypothetical protein